MFSLPIFFKISAIFNATIIFPVPGLPVNDICKPGLPAKSPSWPVHARTRKEMSKVPARWERLTRVAQLRDELSPETVLIGNGDVLSLEDGLEKAELSGVDGVMVGRALFGNPWFFNPAVQLPVRLKALPTKGVNRDTLHEVAEAADGIEFVTLEDRLRVLVEHSYLFAELLPFKNFNIMKKHYKAYVNSFEGAAELRSELMQQSTPADVERVVTDFLAKQ